MKVNLNMLLSNRTNVLLLKRIEKTIVSVWRRLALKKYVFRDKKWALGS
jgi:hypothetical protein